jgi:hypothetical protein
MGFGVLIEHEIFAPSGLMKTLLYTLEEKLDWPRKKKSTGVSSINHVPTRHMINWGGGIQSRKKTYENFYSVFGYNLAKQKQKSVCKNAGI